MRGLSESLAEYGEVMLRAIAAQWEVEPAPPESLPARLAAAMREPERLQAFVAALEEQARAALARVAAAGGSLRGHLFTRYYGEVRRLGPRALEREEPWRNPAGPGERLWYAGLIFRRYGRLGAYHGEVYYLPPDLLAALPPLRAPSAAIVLAPVSEPASARDECDALALDLELVLARLRLEGVQAASGGGLPPSFVKALAGRWRGSAEPERLALLLRLGLRTRLIARHGEALQTGAQARDWLELGAHARQKLLFDAWQADPHWNELRHVLSLRCEDTGWRNDPLAPRAGLLAALQACPEGWLGLADLAAALKATQHDLARPDGDYDSWYIRDARTGQYLQGFAHWDQVEGALIAHLVTRSLFWLGAVALGSESAEAPATTFRLTAGRAFLGQAPPPAEVATPPLVVGADLHVVVDRRARALDRVRVERFARWQGRRGQADLFQIDPECVWRALNAGVQVRQIEGFLRRAAGGRLPAEVGRALRTWGQRFAQLTLRRAVLLQADSAETLRQLQSDPELAQRLGAVVSERAILVPEDQLPQVLARLKALCWWPRLEGLDEP